MRYYLIAVIKSICKTHRLDFNDKRTDVIFISTLFSVVYYIIFWFEIKLNLYVKYRAFL